MTSKKTILIRLGAAVLVLVLFAVVGGLAQSGRQTISATAMGDGTNFGKLFNVTIIIEGYSTPEDQQVLLQAFQKGGNEALVDTLEKMSPKGRLTIPGMLGYEVTYVRVWPTPTGRKIRMVTSRPITFPEARGSTRSAEYTLSALELDLSNEKGKSTGTLLPLCQLGVNKEGQIEIEAFQNPWRLTNVIDWGNK